VVVERDPLVRLMERVQFDLVDLVVQVLTALEDGVLAVQPVVLVVRSWYRAAWCILHWRCWCRWGTS
jgi:hypothetical protein